jgi:hypothetical protein
MFIVKRNRAASRPAYEATIAVCDVRDKPFYAEEDYPVIAIQHRLVGGNMEHHADLEQYIASIGCEESKSRCEHLLGTRIGAGGRRSFPGRNNHHRNAAPGRGWTKGRNQGVNYRSQSASLSSAGNQFRGFPDSCTSARPAVAPVNLPRSHSS